MAVTLTQIELSSAIRLGDSAEEVAEATRLLAFATEAISRHLGDAYADAPETIVNEAAIRLAGYFYDQPNAGRGLSFANAGRNSGAWAILLPFRVHRAGTTGDAVAAAQEALGTVNNPVTDVSVDAGAATITVTFTDGTTRTDNLPAGMGGGGADQTARDAAAAAQADVDAHELAPHNTDTVARSTAVNARQIGEAAQATADAVRTELATHETTPHGGGGGTDQTARDAAAAAQAGLAAHEATPHNTDATARSVAQNARTTAEQAQTAVETHRNSTHNTDTTARNAAAAAQGTADNAATAATAAAATANANTGRLDAFPAGTGGVDQTARDAADGAQGTADGAQTAAAAAQGAIAAHERAPHNTDAGARTAAANAQSAIEDHERTTHNTDTTARDAAAAAQSDADTAQTTAGQAQATATAASTAANAAQADIDDHEANHPTGTGGGPTVLFETATAAIGTSTGLIPGNVACPETGALEFYFEGLTGTRQGAVAYARIPVARIRGAVSALSVAYSNNSATLLAIPHGANRGVGIAVQTTTNYLMLSAQAPGDFYIRVAHTV